MFDPGKEQAVSALGKEWKLPRMDFALLCAFRDLVKGELSDPFAGIERLFPHMSEALQRETLKDCIRRREALDLLDINDPIVQKFGATGYGVLQRFWLMLQRYQPDVSFVDAGRIAEEIGIVKVGTIEDAARGRSEGNQPVAPV